jgi:hypothetical protein
VKRNLTALIIFGIAFGFLEAAVVFYLRVMLGYKSGYPLGNYQTLFGTNFISFITTEKPFLGTMQIARAEIAREVATIVMLVAVAFLSAKKFLPRLGALMIAFSLWDIFYYVFLKFLTGWPTSFGSTDIYFLIPVPWIGPVITPLIISLALFLAGLKLYT